MIREAGQAIPRYIGMFKVFRRGDKMACCNETTKRSTNDPGADFTGNLFNSSRREF